MENNIKIKLVFVYRGGNQSLENDQGSWQQNYCSAMRQNALTDLAFKDKIYMQAVKRLLVEFREDLAWF